MKIPESAYLTGIPIVGTALAYLFEAGFATFHGIPLSFVQLSISQLVGTGVLAMLVLWLLHTYFAVCVAFLARRKHFLFKPIGLGMLYAALPLILIAGLGWDNKNLWVAAAVLFLLPTVTGLIDALTASDKSIPFTQRWMKRLLSPDSKPSSSDGLDELIDKPQLFFSLSLFVTFLAFSTGHRYASFAEPRLVLKSDPTKAFVVIYGEKWFFRPSDEIQKARNLTPGDLFILTGDSVKEIILHERPKQPAVSASAP